MANQTYTVRRGSNQLGVFSAREVSALYAKGRLLAGDEVGLLGGAWQGVDAFLKSNPQQASVPPVAATSSALPRHTGYYVTFKGQRHGPLELSKIKAMIEANLLDSTAMLEGISTPGRVVPIDSVIPIVPPPLPPSAQAPVAHPQQGPVVAPISPGSSPSVKPKVSYFNLWWKATLWIYGIMAVFGFLANNVPGLAIALGAGLILAPIKGAFWAWIIWLIRK